MIANYHAHTWRCGHASGTEREYIEEAIQGGIRILGFSDHAPMPFRDGYVSPVRMRPQQLEDYISTLEDLRKEYAGQITLHIGLEAEYYPALFDDFLAFIRDYPIEYLIHAQHYAGNEIHEKYTGYPTANVSDLIRYVDQTIQAMDRGCYLYLAHPDLIHFTGDRDIYCREMRRLCEHAKKLDLPLEINFLGISDHRNYPDQVFWEIAGDVGNTVVFGADAHHTGMVVNPQAEKTAVSLMKTCGLRSFLPDLEDRLRKG